MRRVDLPYANRDGHNPHVRSGHARAIASGGLGIVPLTMPGHFIVALGNTRNGNGLRLPPLRGSFLLCISRGVEARLRSDLNVRSGGRAPRMVTRLACLVHNRQGAAAGEDKRHSEYDHQ